MNEGWFRSASKALRAKFVTGLPDNCKKENKSTPHMKNVQNKRQENTTRHISPSAPPAQWESFESTKCWFRADSSFTSNASTMKVTLSLFIFLMTHRSCSSVLITDNDWDQRGSRQKNLCQRPNNRSMISRSSKCSLSVHTDMHSSCATAISITLIFNSTFFITDSELNVTYVRKFDVCIF